MTRRTSLWKHHFRPAWGAAGILLAAFGALEPVRSQERAGGAGVPPAQGSHAADTLTSLYGTVRHAGGGGPVENAHVRLIVRRRAVLTDSAGRYRFDGLPPGVDTVRVNVLGLAPRESVVRLRPGSAVRLDVEMDVAPVGVEELRVQLERGRRTRLARLQRRIATGTGQYITRNEIDRAPGQLSLLFHHVVGARVDYAGSGRFSVLLRNLFDRGTCTPHIFINGGRAVGFRVDDFEPPDVAGIEVYPGPEIPSEFQSVDGCGAIVIWTRWFTG
ncbi:MAG: carboxypeptidase-like regulatory domain-containing protein [Gemmatimonadota bacterium]